jgi:5-methylcytosine-specific restriction endonuclease McrA
MGIGREVAISYTISKDVAITSFLSIPISKSGTSDLGNLQTLCLDCNLGKSNRLPSA